MSVALGVIGAGSIASIHLDNADEMPDVDVRAVADVDEDAAREAAEPRDATAYADGKRLLREESLDAVLIAVPPFAHPEYERAALESGLDLFVEKPLGLSLQTVEATRDRIADADVLAAAGYVCRYAEVTDRLRKLLEGRTIGTIETTYTAPAPEAEWWRRRDRSGGQIVEQATHPYDIHRYVAGEVAAVAGAGTEARLVEDVDFHDASSVTLVHENGAVSHVGATCGASAFTFETRVVAEGTQLTVDFVDHELRGVVDGEDVCFEGAGDWYRRELRAFADAVTAGSSGPIRSDYADATETLGLTLAAREAVESGERCRP